MQVEVRLQGAEGLVVDGKRREACGLPASWLRGHSHCLLASGKDQHSPASVLVTSSSVMENRPLEEGAWTAQLDFICISPPSEFLLEKENRKTTRNVLFAHTLVIFSARMLNQGQKESLKSNIQSPSVLSQYPGTIKLKQTKLSVA